MLLALEPPSDLSSRIGASLMEVSFRQFDIWSKGAPALEGIYKPNRCGRKTSFRAWEAAMGLRTD